MGYVGTIVTQNVVDTATIADASITTAKLATNAVRDEMPSGSVIQTVQTVITSTVDVGSIAQGAESGNVSGFTRTITPISSSNKVLVAIHANVGASTNNQASIVTLYRDDTKVTAFVGDTASNRKRTSSGSQGTSNPRDIAPTTLTFLDSPSSTSELTYSIRLSHNEAGAMNLYLNRSSSDSDNNYENRTASSIILQEIKG